MFETYWDELGNGEPRLNHPLIYRDVLKEMGVDLPPTASAESRPLARLPGRVVLNCRCTGCASAGSPRTFLPEVLGLNLAMELVGGRRHLPQGPAGAEGVRLQHALRRHPQHHRQRRHRTLRVGRGRGGHADGRPARHARPRRPCGDLAAGAGGLPLAEPAERRGRPASPPAADASRAGGDETAHPQGPRSAAAIHRVAPGPRVTGLRVPRPAPDRKQPIPAHRFRGGTQRCLT
ncbi:iron-containing redox enzyme family protein [Streptomyces tricolor]|nr:iron-containing redox enzyme family protein [Streptomyces tricolor]